MLYLQDNNETFFPMNYNDAAGGRVEWCFYLTPGSHGTVNKSQGMLGPYLKNNKIWTCPSAHETLLGSSLPSPFPTYGLNVVLSGTHKHLAPKLAQVQMPSATILAADSARPNLGSGMGASWSIFPPSTGQPWVCGRHLGFAEVLWLDGHVNAQQPKADPQTGWIGAPEQQQDHLGNIIKQPYTGNAQIDDYFYELVKPLGN